MNTQQIINQAADRYKATGQNQTGYVRKPRRARNLSPTWAIYGALVTVVVVLVAVGVILGAI